MERKLFAGGIVCTLTCLIFAILIALPTAASAFRPSGWGYISWPYQYDEGAWYYYNPSDIQWVSNTSTGTWSQLRESPLAYGWSYWKWPYAYSGETNTWYYIRTTDTPWMFSFYSSCWYKLGDIYPCFAAYEYCHIMCGLGNCGSDCLNQYNLCMESGSDGVMICQ